MCVCVCANGHILIRPSCNTTVATHRSLIEYVVGNGTFSITSAKEDDGYNKLSGMTSSSIARLHT